MTFEILSFISDAAALVKVTTRSLSASTGCCVSVISSITFCTSKAVLPEHDASETSIVQPFEKIESFWLSVQFLLIIILLWVRLFANSLQGV